MAYSIEEEQEINQLKDWWKENGKAIIVAFVLGVGGMFGWRYWQVYQTNQIIEAKNAVARQDFIAASTALEQALAQSQDEILTSLAAVRLSAVQFQSGQLDNALSTLNQVKSASFNARKALLSGDIQLAKGDQAAAKSSFEQALQNGSPLERQAAQMKLNNL